MKKRAYERIPSDVKVDFFCSNAMYTGTLKNVSKRGMCIDTDTCFPLKSEFEVRIPFNNEVIEVPVKVRRLIKTDDYYRGIGVELVNSHDKYHEFVSSLMWNHFNGVQTQD
ncbi:MAG: PilZ domain-containing protein [Deferribacteres bacterium]|nr:PilZ domain-containing protein [Deferribacteres bacterium]